MHIKATVRRPGRAAALFAGLAAALALQALPAAAAALARPMPFTPEATMSEPGTPLKPPPPPQPPDPARAPVDLLAREDAEFAAAFGKLYEQTWGPGELSAKTKELCGVALSVVTRCEPCLAHHLTMAAKAGATGREAIEAMRIGLLSGGSITLPTVRAGYARLQQLGLIE